MNLQWNSIFAFFDLIWYVPLFVSNKSSLLHPPFYIFTFGRGPCVWCIFNCYHFDLITFGFRIILFAYSQYTVECSIRNVCCFVWHFVLCRLQISIQAPAHKIHSVRSAAVRHTMPPIQVKIKSFISAAYSDIYHSIDTTKTEYTQCIHSWVH